MSSVKACCIWANLWELIPDMLVHSLSFYGTSGRSDNPSTFGVPNTSTVRVFSVGGVRKMTRNAYALQQNLGTFPVSVFALFLMVS